MAESIEQLRIYKQARTLEDQVYELVKLFPGEQFYTSANDLRRTSAAVSHYIMEAHRFYSYRLKLDALANMRREAEITQKLLDGAREHGATDEMIAAYTDVIKQSWGLSKWLKVRLAEKVQQASITAKDEMVAAMAV